MESAPLEPARRLFIAVMLPAQVQHDLAELSGLLSAHHVILRTVRPEALHFTLRFLGQKEAEQERLAAEACAAASGPSTAFALAIGGFGAFPNMRRPRVIWLGLREGAEALTTLARGVEDELLARRVVVEREQFTPHLTLARVRPDAAPAARDALATGLQSLPPGVQARCMATEISLVHSTLTPKGSRYSVLGQWPLKAQQEPR